MSQSHTDMPVCLYVHVYAKRLTREKNFIEDHPPRCFKTRLFGCQRKKRRKKNAFQNAKRVIISYTLKNQTKIIKEQLKKQENLQIIKTRAETVTSQLEKFFKHFLILKNFKIVSRRSIYPKFEPCQK